MWLRLRGLFTCDVQMCQPHTKIQKGFSASVPLTISFLRLCGRHSTRLRCVHYTQDVDFVKRLQILLVVIVHVVSCLRKRLVNILPVHLIVLRHDVPLSVVYHPLAFFVQDMRHACPRLDFIHLFARHICTFESKKEGTFFAFHTQATG